MLALAALLFYTILGKFNKGHIFMQITAPSTVSSSQFYLLASAQNVDANSVATTALNWQNGASAGNSIPMVGRVFRRTGTLSLLVATLRLNSTIIQPISAVSSALLGAAANPLNFLLDTNVSATVFPLAGNWDINVTTFNGSAATVDVEIWGFKG